MIAWEESPRQFKMSKQLDEGKFGEDLARKFLNDPIIKVNHGISHYDDVTQDKYDQKRLVEYADYKPGMLYVSVYEVFPAETDAGLS